MRLVCLVGLLTAFACSGDGSTPDADATPPLPDALSGSQIVSGTISGADARAGDFNGLFTVSIGQSGLFSFGLGRSTDGVSYSMAMPPSVPIEAQNGGTIALAYVIMTEVGNTIPEGRVASSSEQDKIIGISPNVMVVYRAAPFVTQFPWEDDFDAGWTCGLCQRAPVINQPDSLTPIDCSAAAVEMGDFSTINVCAPFPE